MSLQCSARAAFSLLCSEEPWEAAIYQITHTDPQTHTHTHTHSHTLFPLTYTYSFHTHTHTHTHNTQWHFNTLFSYLVSTHMGTIIVGFQLTEFHVIFAWSTFPVVSSLCCHFFHVRFVWDGGLRYILHFSASFSTMKPITTFSHPLFLFSLSLSLPSPSLSFRRRPWRRLSQTWTWTSWRWPTSRPAWMAEMSCSQVTDQS